jgi:hypothetical protein
MGKLIMLALIGAAVYVGWEVHDKGTDQAFDGALAPSAAATDDSQEALGARPMRLSPHAQMGAVPGVD